MGLTVLRAFLKRHRRIALDTSIFIYYLEENPSYVEMAGEVFGWLERPTHTAVTSSITMTELLVQPYRLANQLLVDQYYGLLSLFPNLEWVAPDLEIADTGARLRARYGLRTPDALQASTAICRGAGAILTNDQNLARVADVEVGIFDRMR